jgi:hypothetical protein
VKSVLSFLFIAFLLWNYLGFFTYFQIEKYAVKKAIKLKLKQSVAEDELFIFEFTAAESKNLIWYEAHEFGYKNVMYDIVYVDTLQNGSLRYSCVSDLQETKLFAQLDQQVNQQVNDENQLPIANWKSVINQPQFIPSLTNIVWAKEIFKIKKEYFSSNYSILSGVVHLFSPPPDSNSFLL